MNETPKHDALAWLKSSLKYVKPEATISPLGERVVELLGDLYFGIYHIHKEALKVDWSNNYYIQITLRDSGWSTFDFDNLTRFVFLCHDYGIRGTFESAAFHYIRLIFHNPESCSGKPHPSIEQAVARFRQYHPETHPEGE